MEIVDTKFVDVKIEAGVLKVEVSLAELAKPKLEALKAKIPGQIDDVLIDKILEALK